MRQLNHPERERFRLTDVLDALSDPTRLAIVLRLAECACACCGDFDSFATKPNLTYHFARLREAGIIRVKAEGTSRRMSLRLEELEARFPGLMPAVLAAARTPDETATASFPPRVASGYDGA